jgi:hypothetical protein
MENTRTILQTPDPAALNRKIADLEARLLALESMFHITNNNVTIRADNFSVKANVSVTLQGPGGSVGADVMGVNLNGNGPIRCSASQFVVDSYLAKFTVSSCSFTGPITAPAVSTATKSL